MTTAPHPVAPLSTAGRRPVDGILAAIGDTPLVRLDGFVDGPRALHAKLESLNPGGSTKDRPANQMISDAIDAGLIARGSVVVESSSGNTGIGVAQACRWWGLRCICVVDARTQTANLALLRALDAEVEVVDQPGVDPLVARIERVRQLTAAIPGAWWPNQYANPSNARAHELGTMAEIDAALGDDLDVLFVATSSTGTLAGCLAHLRARGRRTRVVAVDAEASALFGGTPGRRLLPGLGAGRVPELAAGCHPDAVVRVSELDCVVGCRRVARTDAVVVGASAGGVLAAVRRSAQDLRGLVCAAVLADSGERYLDTVFDDAWVAEHLGVDADQLAALVGPDPEPRL